LRHADILWAAAVFALTTVLTVLSFPPFQTPEFAYAFAVPAIYWAYRRPSLRLFAWTLFAAQAVAWTVLLSWLHPVTWVGLLLAGPVIGAWVGVWYLAAWWAMPRMIGRTVPVRLAAQLGLAGLWVVIEWSRTWLLSGSPWLPLAASQWQRTSVLQIAAYTGAGGVSFVLIAMNIGFAAYAHRLLCEGRIGFAKRSQEFLLALFLLLVCLSVLVQETINRRYYNRPLGRIAIVQPDIPQAVKWDPAKGPGIVRVLQGLTLQVSASHPDLILWPEAVTPWAVKGDPGTRAFVESISARAQAPLLLGSIAIEEGPPRKWFNAAFVATPDLGVQTAYYAKRHLVPFGEYVPLRPVLGWLSKFVPIGDDFIPGTDSTPLIVSMRDGAQAFGILICYEDIFPQLARQDVLSGADVLAVLTNDGWYGEGAAAYQHAAHSVLRAVETRRPVLRCGNAGWSGWIDEFGAIRSVLTNDNDSVYFRGARTLDVTRDSRWSGRNSFYVEHGDWFVLAGVLLAAFGWAALATGRVQLAEA
jgi:apolipoprotein N-acyltransferase